MMATQSSPASGEQLAPGGTPALALRGLEVSVPGRHGRLQIVDGVTWSVGAGETVCVVGESGAGKSMSMYAAARLAPDAARIQGSVLFEGREVLTMSRRELRGMRGTGGMGFVFQDPLSALNPVLSIGSQLREVVGLHRGLGRREAHAVAVDLLEQVKIKDPAHTLRCHPHQLSGGMRQRVVIASALAGEPHVLIADEPTTSLDALVQLGILNLLADLQRSHRLAMVVITHDLGVARAIADTVVVMYAGRVVEMGMADQVFARPAHPYTAALIASTPRLAHAEGRARIKGSPPDLEALPRGCRFSPRCAYAKSQCLEVDPPLIGADSAGHQAACLWPGVAAGSQAQQ